MEPLYLIEKWFNEDQLAKHDEDTCLKEIELHVQIAIATLHLVVSTIGRIYLYS
jgi:hypothetical protein